jgi:hypothetical protein
MRRTMLLTALAGLALSAIANDGVELSMKTKALAAAGTGVFVNPAKQSSSAAPFTYAHDPMPQLVLLDDQEKTVAQSACDSSVKQVCYDVGSQRIVYRGAREYMPSVQGMRPESLSVRHNRVVFSYSFK